MATADSTGLSADSTANTADAEPAGGGITFDSTGHTFDSTTLRFDQAGAVLSASAAQTLPAFTQVAAAQAVARASTSQSIPRPTQAATATTGPAPILDRTASALQLIPPPNQTAQAVAVPIPPPPPLPPEVLVPVEVPVETGDLADMIARQVAVLPPWFGTPGIVPPTLRLPLAMAGSLGSWLYGLIAYARKQARIHTASGGWLDLIAWDFFGTRIRRRSGQNDESFRKRILTELFRPRATRPAMASVLRDLTGREPRIFEPSRPQDVGGIGIPSGLGIGVSGAIGSISLPGQVFIEVFRSPDAGIPFAAGIGIGVGGIGVPSRLVVASMEQIRGALTDQDIYATIEATRPAGIVTWVRISL